MGAGSGGKVGKGFRITVLKEEGGMSRKNGR